MGRAEGAAEHQMPPPYFWILSLRPSVHFFLTQSNPAAVATRQTSSSGRPKSPRIQVVLPEELCDRLSVLAEAESRTVSNMAKVLIQQGVERLERQRATHDAAAPQASPPAAMPSPQPRGALASDTGSSRQEPAASHEGTERIRQELEQRQQEVPRPQRRGPRRVRLRPPT